MKQKLQEFRRTENVNHKSVMQHFVSVMSADSVFLQYAKGEIAKGCIRVGMTKGQSNYIAQQMLPAWLDRAQQIKKNDIFDMLCMNIYESSLPYAKIDNVLIDTYPYLLTFDNRMKEYIKNNKPNNYRIIEQFYIK